LALLTKIFLGIKRLVFIDLLRWNVARDGGLSTCPRHDSASIPSSQAVKFYSISNRPPRVATTIGIDLGDVWSHYCTLNEDGEVIDRGRFRTMPKAIEKWLTDVPHARIAMEAGTHSIWISEQLQELGHEVIVANVRELRAISHRDRKRPGRYREAGTVRTA
jgi:hypothetical protein